MIIYPAIDIKDGKCVRLQQGDYSKVTVYSDDPAETARKWEEAGAYYLHVVDLDGARGGKQPDIELISNIAASTGMKVQLGGGLRNMEAVDKALAAGIFRVILGTSAVSDRAFLETAVRKYGGGIAVGIDARDGKVAIEGWERTSELYAVEFAKAIEALGVKTIIYTDISRDGMLQGPNLKAMSEMAGAVGIDVIASGGVSRLEDIMELEGTGVSGVIIGKALYTGGIDLKKALEAVKGE
jgi:phosphoribosylformimino-5-aminoimidazole carboxamide ribotide isomerase